MGALASVGVLQQYASLGEKKKEKKNKEGRVEKAQEDCVIYKTKAVQKAARRESAKQTHASQPISSELSRTHRVDFPLECIRKQKANKSSQQTLRRLP